MFWLRIFRVKFQSIFKGGETKARNVEIIIFTSSAHGLVFPAKYLTYCSQRQTQRAGGRGFLRSWSNASVFVILQYLIFPWFTLTLWGEKTTKTQKVIRKKSSPPFILIPTQVWVQAEIPFSFWVNRPYRTLSLPEEKHMLECFSKSGPYFSLLRYKVSLVHSFAACKHRTVLLLCLLFH